MKNATTRLGALALAMPLALAGVAQAQTKMTVGYAPIAETEAVFAAKDAGYFAANGLDVTTIRMGIDAVSALFGGSVDISSVPTTSFLQAADSGLDLLLVSTCGVTAPRTAKSVALIARTGVTIDKPEDVVGKKLGVPGVGGLLDVLFQRWLQQKGIAPAQVTTIEVQIPNTVDVLRTGSVDAIVAGEPFVSRAVDAGVGKVAFNFMADLPAGIPYSVMVTTKVWAAAHGAEMAAFRKSVAEGAELSRTDPARMQEINAKFTGLPIEVVRRVELPECRTVPNPVQLDWLIGTMRAQHKFQSNQTAKALIAP